MLRLLNNVYFGHLQASSNVRLHNFLEYWHLRNRSSGSRSVLNIYESASLRGVLLKFFALSV